MNRLAIIAVLMILWTASAFLFTHANALQKGVTLGDYFTYGNFQMYVNPPDTPLFSSWQKFQNITMINFTITENQPPDPYLISFNQTIKFIDDSVTEMQGTVNISTGEGQGYLYFISAGLGQSDRIYPGNANFTWAINETRVDPNWGGREICMLNITDIESSGGIIMLTKTIIKWDKLTGALLSLYETKAGSVGSDIFEGTLSFQIVENNRGIVPEFPSLIILPLLMIAMLSTALLSRRKHRIKTG